MDNKSTDKQLRNKNTDRCPGYLSEKYTLKFFQTMHFSELFMYTDGRAHI